MEQTKKKSIYNATSIRYGTTNFSTSLITTMASAYFSVFLTGTIGISPLVMGTIMTVAGLADTISIPIIGVLIQKASFKSGKFRPWLLVGGITCAVLSWLRFTDIGLTGTAQAVYFGVVYTLCYLAFNLAYSSYTGIMPLLARDPSDRVALASCRIQFNSLSKFILGLISVQLIMFFGGGETNARGYSGFAALLAVFVFAGIFQLYLLAKPIDVVKTDAAGKVQKSAEDDASVFEMLRMIISGPMLLYLVAAILKIATYFSVTAIAAYYYDYVIGDRALLTVFLSLSTLLMIIGATATPLVARLVGGSRNAFILGGVIYGGSMLVSYLARGNAMTFTILMCLGYVGYSFMHSSEAAVYSNIVDYTQYKTGKDMKGFLMSIFSLSPKIGSVFQGMVLGIGLTAIGFDAQNVTDQAVRGIPLLMSLFPGLLLAVAVVCMLLFPLTDKKVRVMQQEIDARAAAQTGASETK